MNHNFNVFYLGESASMPGKYVIKVDHEKFHCSGTIGSYNLLPARLLGISPANYYRLARDEYGGEIYGKNTSYPVVYFSQNNKSELLVRTLNELAYLVESERQHLDAIEWAENNRKDNEKIHLEDEEYCAEVLHRLNVRKEPSLNSEIVRILEKDTHIKIMEEQQGFGLVGDGWVKLDFIKRLKDC